MERGRLVGILATGAAAVGLAAILFVFAGSRAPTEPIAEAPPAPAAPAVAAPTPVTPSPAASAPAAEGPRRAVSCALRVLADGSAGDLPPLEAGVIAYENPLDADPAHPSTFEIDVYADHIAFDPPPDVTRGYVRVADYLETSISWSTAGCANVLLRPAARVTGRVTPSWGRPQVVGCGTSAAVADDGTFEMAVAPGPCMLRAVRDDDGVLVDSEPVEVDAQWETPADVDLELPAEIGGGGDFIEDVVEEAPRSPQRSPQPNRSP